MGFLLTVVLLESSFCRGLEYKTENVLLVNCSDNTEPAGAAGPGGAAVIAQLQEQQRVLHSFLLRVRALGAAKIEILITEDSEGGLLLTFNSFQVEKQSFNVLLLGGLGTFSKIMTIREFKDVGGYKLSLEMCHKAAKEARIHIISLLHPTGAVIQGVCGC